MNKNALRHRFKPCCLATTIGSLPHKDVARGTELMFETTPEIPSWVQFPKRILYESMMLQFTEGMPALVKDGNRTYFSTFATDFVEELTDFYQRYLAVIEDRNLQVLDSFSLSPQYAAGFYEFIAQLPERVAGKTPYMLKGQVTGPFTLGINLLSQDGRCSYYDQQLRDVIIKTISMKAMWQIVRLNTFGLPVMIFLDEPSLFGFGKQMFLTISREDVIRGINEVTEVIHANSALAGVHCEANTDWSLLMETNLDILDFDAYDHFQAIALYPVELAKFLKRGGCLGWGIVPTLDREVIATETVSSLLIRFEEGVDQIVSKGFNRELLLQQTLLTPSCGAGGILTEPLAELALSLLHELSATLRKRYEFG